MMMLMRSLQGKEGGGEGWDGKKLVINSQVCLLLLLYRYLLTWRYVYMA